MNYKPLSDVELENVAAISSYERPLLQRMVEQCRRADDLAAAAQRRLDEWNRDTYVALRDAVRSYRGET